MRRSATHKLNPAGVIPPIFAGSLIMFPATLGQFLDYPIFKTIAEAMHPTSIYYIVIYVSLIIFFCYFYTGVTFNPEDVSNNLKRNGGFIPGIRPGKPTVDYIDKVLTRLVFWGALYISIICLVPTFVSAYFKVPFYFGGTALLIVVGVSLDTIGQIQSYTMNTQYESIMKKGIVSRRK